MPLRMVCRWMLIVGLAQVALAEDDYLSGDELKAAGLIKFWQMRLPLEADQRILDAYLVDDQLYLATQDGFVFAVQADTGALRWMKQVTRSGYRLARPCHANDQTIFVTPTRALLVDRLTGDGIGEKDLRFPSGTGVVSDGARFYVGGINQRYYAFAVGDQFEVWKAGTSGPISSTPALRDGNLYVAGEDSGVYACLAANKTLLWQTNTDGPNTADVVADESGVYVASRDQSLYLLDALRGDIRWRARFSGPLSEAPVVTRDLVFQFCADDGLVAVENDPVKEENRLRWKLPHGRFLLTVDAKNAYVLTRDDMIEVVSLSDGNVSHSVAAPGFALAMPSPRHAAVLVGAPDGRLFCARLRGVPFVRRDDVRRAMLPPGMARASTQPAASQPVARNADKVMTNVVGSGLPGPATGGKSKVSRNFGSGSGAPRPASERPAATSRPASGKP